MGDTGLMSTTLPAQPSARTSPGGLTEPDAERLTSLRRMKLLAVSFLIFAAIVYLVMRWLEHRDGADVAGWVGYVRAASEAGMVGALADWFAVTALFKHPLRLPIPHTALIPRKKDEIGEQLGGFIEENFMIPEVIAERARTVNLPGRVSGWVADPANAGRVNDEVSRAFGLVSEMLRDEDVEKFIQSVLKWAAEPVWAPPVGRVLQQLVDEDRLEPVIQLLCDRAHDWALGSQGLIDRVVDRDGPAWTPRFVNNLVGDKIYRELTEFTFKVRADPHHELRLAMIEFVHNFADDLQHDDVMIAKFEGIKEELLGRDEVTGAASTAWQAGKAVIEQMIDDPKSTLRTSLADAVVRFAVRVRDDEPLLEKINSWVARAGQHVAENYSTEIISVITETVRGWDAEETSRKLELQVGRDLQFIRINGTVVGALAGLAIYTASELLFG